ncbi:hypothetical protein RSSM_03120 [Rhodopirellula sallentina SM41]|uniref:Uncharacterized protein n=1 Tax=Rhodopirellula sallentina SM41 TaxID=1263870 RepID=M5U1Y7_9BACT|nr:hypothetical protein RSSM_03120 [Rhodopirellula sallentina SM41]
MGRGKHHQCFVLLRLSCNFLVAIDLGGISNRQPFQPAGIQPEAQRFVV